MKTAINFIIITLILNCFSSLIAQNNEGRLLLSKYLKSLEQKHNISFSYNPVYIKNLSFEELQDDDSLEKSLKNIQVKFELIIEKSGKDNYLILPKRTHISFQVIDKENSLYISPVRIRINQEKEKYYFPRDNQYTIENVYIRDSIHINSYPYKSRSFAASTIKEQKNIIYLNYSTTDLNEVVIKNYLTSGIHTKLSDHSFKIEMDNLGLLAGETDGDIYNVVKNIPGISSPDGKPGNLTFRGSPFDQNLTIVDKIPIYHKGHFFGTLSPFNPISVEEVEVQRNIIPAEYGGKTGGILSVKTTETIPKTSSYQIIFNSLYAGASIKAPILKDKLALFITGRSNYPNVNSSKLTAFSQLNFQGSNAEKISNEINTSSNNIDANFYDINAKLIYKIHKNHKLSLSTILIKNDFDSAIYDDKPGKDETDTYTANLNNWGVNFKWEANLTKQLQSTISFVNSSFNIYNNEKRIINSITDKEETLDNSIEDVQFISQFKYKVTSDLSIEAGYSHIRQLLKNSKIKLNESRPPKKDENAIIHSSYVNIQKDWNKKLNFNFGVHTDYYTPLSTFYIDPRFTSTYRLSKATLLKLSGGQTHQYLQQELRTDFDDFRVKDQIWFLAQDEESVLKGQQAMIGALFTKHGWLLDLEVYKKKTINVSQNINKTRIKGNTESIGLDFLIKKRWKVIETWVSYSLSKTEMDFDSSTSSIFDQTNILNITNILHLNNWNFAATWSYASGLPVIIPTNDDPNSTDFNASVIEYNNRFPAQHQLDFSSTYTFSPSSKKWKGIVGLSLINIYNRQNIINVFQNNPHNNNPYRKSLGFIPNLQLSFQF